MASLLALKTSRRQSNTTIPATTQQACYACQADDIMLAMASSARLPIKLAGSAVGMPTPKAGS